MFVNAKVSIPVLEKPVHQIHEHVQTTGTICQPCDAELCAQIYKRRIGDVPWTAGSSIDIIMKSTSMLLHAQTDHEVTQSSGLLIDNIA